MTISTSQASEIFLGNGVTTSFSFSFIASSSNLIEVSYADVVGNVTVLNPSQYTIFINAPATGSLWGIGGTVSYPTIGSPIAAGTSLTVTRVRPFVQETSISDQGPFAPSVIESALDILEMQIQQVAGRTGQFRGTWITNILYNYADIVQDGVNGADTGNIYMCVTTNTSGVWATDLANGDWVLAIDVGQLGPISSITGTSNRITVTNPTTTPIINIAANYVGQTSLTTLGTVTTGTWQGTPIALLFGGTGATTASGARTALGLGTSATLDVGVAANNVVQLNGSSQLPAVSGVNLTGITASQISGLPFSKSYTSTPQSITDGGTITLTHGLGAVPKFAIATLACSTNNSGYTVGQVFFANPAGDITNVSTGNSLIYSSTTVVIRFGSSGQELTNPTNGAGTLAASADFTITYSFLT